MQITKVEDNIGTCKKAETDFQIFCKLCGGHVIRDLLGFNLVEVYLIRYRILFTSQQYMSTAERKQNRSMPDRQDSRICRLNLADPTKYYRIS